jgi:hypothetical protein
LRYAAAAILEPVNRALNLSSAQVVEVDFAKLPDEVFAKLPVPLQGLRCTPAARVLCQPVSNVLRKRRIDIDRCLLGSGSAFYCDSESLFRGSLSLEPGFLLFAEYITPS